MTIILLSMGIACFAIVAWVQYLEWRRRKAAEIPAPTASYRPLPPPPSPPPLSPARRFESALRQAGGRAFTAWWKALRRCPACGASDYYVAPKQGERAVEYHSPRTGRGGFIAWTQEIGCRTCGWSMSFPHTDTSPVEAAHLHLDAGAVVPRVWIVTTIAGSPAGRVHSDAAGIRTEVAAEADGPARAGLAIAAAMIHALAEGVEPGVSDDERDRIRARVLDDLGRLHGVRVQPDS